MHLTPAILGLIGLLMDSYYRDKICRWGQSPVRCANRNSHSSNLYAMMNNGAKINNNHFSFPAPEWQFLWWLVQLSRDNANLPGFVALITLFLGRFRRGAAKHFGGLEKWRGGYKVRKAVQWEGQQWLADKLVVRLCKFKFLCAMHFKM